MFVAAGCSDKQPDLVPGAGGPGASGAPGSSADPGQAGASGAPAPANPGTGGTATDKAACETVRTKLSEWTMAFAQATSKLPEAGNDVRKIETIVKDARDANGKFAAALRGEAGKTKDEQLKKVASDMAAALDKVSSSLDAQKIAADSTALNAVFDAPEYAAAADAFEKACA